jgi:hypothetical protein
VSSKSLLKIHELTLLLDYRNHRQED